MVEERGASTSKLASVLPQGDSLYTFMHYRGNCTLGSVLPARIAAYGLHRVHLVFGLDFSRELPFDSRLLYR